MVSNAASISETLLSLKPELHKRFGVVRLALFGSVARGDSRADSDIDVLVGFESGARTTYFRLAELEALLEGALRRKIDVIPEDSLDPRIAPRIHADMLPI